MFLNARLIACQFDTFWAYTSQFQGQTNHLIGLFIHRSALCFASLYTSQRLLGRLVFEPSTAHSRRTTGVDATERRDGMQVHSHGLELKLVVVHPSLQDTKEMPTC